ncbi:MAG: UDP-N-acetylmuramoyl-tripeptide--D-alanyl-D-alanine ligase [Clostridiaceae bacterium]|nr:UDP-N-acetylmuramoyl-tripeptide--D-alanyl-D-alanine ligase [Clostridiaceae bacterium]
MKTRFLPNQLQQWTGGKLIRSKNSANDTEIFYPGISTDTRSLVPGEVFLALRGENFDGHNFIDQAIKRGAGMLIMDANSAQAQEMQNRIHEPGAPELLLVSDTLVAYMKIAAGYRQTLETTIIGVTGSVGKTTTRRMVHQILNSQLRTEQSDANLNNQIGLSYTILSTNAEAQVLVAEIAVDRIDEMAELSALARPDIAIITGIGYSHALYFGSREAILKEKTDLLRDMKDNSLVLLNGNDASLRSWAIANKEDTRFATWFVSSLKYKDEILAEGFPIFWYEDLTLTADSTDFRVKCSFTPEESWPIHLPFAASHLTESTMFGLACAYVQGLEMNLAAQAASDFVNTGARQQISMLEQNILLLDDSYNSSPEAMTSGLTTLSHISESAQRIGVFGDMRELGQYARKLHLEVADQIIDMSFREIYLIGEEMQRVAEYLHTKAPTIKTRWFEDRDTMAQEVLEAIRPRDAIMVKASRYFELEHIADAIKLRFGGK